MPVGTYSDEKLLHLLVPLHVTVCILYDNVVHDSANLQRRTVALQGWLLQRHDEVLQEKPSTAVLLKNTAVLCASQHHTKVNQSKGHKHAYPGHI